MRQTFEQTEKSLHAGTLLKQIRLTDKVIANLRKQAFDADLSTKAYMEKVLTDHSLKK